MEPIALYALLYFIPGLILARCAQVANRKFEYKELTWHHLVSLIVFWWFWLVILFISVILKIKEEK